MLLLHGGPGVSFEYLDGLAEEIGPGFQVAAYQQRGIEPSTLEGPFAVEREVADALAVLDALSWERAWVLGHSWGGHLLFHIAVAAPERLDGGLAVEPLGAVGDGGYDEFEAEMTRRIPEGDRELAERLDEQAMRGEGGPEDALESMRLAWPAYFASPDHVLPFNVTGVSVPAYAGLFESLAAARPRLESALSGLETPFGFLAGARSPMPHDASRRGDRTSDSDGVDRDRRGRRALPVVRAPGLRALRAPAPDRNSLSSDAGPLKRAPPRPIAAGEVLCHRHARSSSASCS